MNTKSPAKQLAFSAFFAVCAMEIAWSGIGWNTMSLYAPAVIEEFGCLRTEFMLCVTFISLCNSIINLFFYGKLVEIFGLKRFMLLSGILCTLSFGVFALSTSVYMMWASAILFGIGIAGVNITTLNVVVDSWFKKNPARYCGMAQTFSAVAGVIFSALWGVLIIKLGWRPCFWITLVVSGLVTLAISVLYKGDPKQLGVTPMGIDEATAQTEEGAALARGEDGISAKEMFKTKQFWMLAIGYVLLGIADYGILGNLSLFANDLGYGNMAGTILSVALIAQAASFLVLGPLTDRFGSRWSIALTFFLLIISAVILLTGKASLFMMYLVGIMLGFADGAAQLPMGASTREAFGSKEFSKKVGTISGCCYFGVSFGPSVLTLFYDFSGSYNTGLIVFIGIAVVVSILMFPATKRVTHTK